VVGNLKGIVCNNGMERLIIDNRARALWEEYERRAEAILARFRHEFTACCFDYEHPRRLQRHTPKRLKSDYPVRCSYLSWGNPENPLVICIGGIVNFAMRFCFLADRLREHFHVVCPDLVGRGLSGWLADGHDYTMETYIEQVRQLLCHLKRRKVIFIGTSLGGSIGIEYCARYPKQVQRLILNDVGPYIPAKRRKRRAETLVRHYAFRTPADLSGKVGVAQINEGPIPEEVRILNTYCQTKWSDSELARVYRHDIRALLTYQREAGNSFVQWEAWDRVDCPVLLIHGMLSDSLLEKTVSRMRKMGRVDIMHVPGTGHAPSLSDMNRIRFIREWLLSRPGRPVEWSALHEGWGERHYSQMPS